MRRIIHLIQFLIAATFIISGLTKCIDPSGTALKFSEYLMYFGFNFALDFTLGMSWVMSILEFIVGINLLLGTARIRSLMLTTILMLFFTPLTLWLAVSNAIDDCGCFGDAIRLSNWDTFFKNLLLDVGLILLWWKKIYMYQLFGRTLRAVYGYWAFSIAIWLCWLGTWSEPWIDFRPFHPGVSLRDAVCNNDNNSQIEYTCIYEKDGVRQEFSLDNLPDEEDGWEFVETIEHTTTDETSMLINGSAIPIDFYVKDPEGTILTESLLSDSSFIFLLLSPSLDNASEHDLDKIEALYEYSIDHDYGFYCVTSHDSQQIARWEDRTGAEYPFLFTDAQIIETITRANPGIMLLHDGVICWKSRLSTLDNLPISSAKLNEQSYGEIKYFDTRSHYFLLFILLFIPIALPLCIEITKTIKVLTLNKNSKNA